MKHTSFAEMNCSIARSLEVVGEWWTLLILRESFKGATRFDDLQGALGIARNILTTRLKTLVEHGILHRTAVDGRTDRFEYRLTRKGYELYPVLLALMQWGDKWKSGRSGPPQRLRHKACKKPLLAEMRCHHCDKIILPEELEADDLSRKA